MRGYLMHGHNRRKHFTPEEIASKAYRPYVGGLWDRMGRRQLALMRQVGLRPGHRLLDVGCGALRGGLHFIRFLDPGLYYGVDFNPSLIEAAQIELAEAGLQQKSPSLLVDGDFNVGAFHQSFDFALAQSLFTHLPAADIEMCLVRVLDVLAAGGAFVATHWKSQSREIAATAHRLTLDHKRVPWWHPRGQLVTAFSRPPH